MKLYFYPGACSLAAHIVLREAGFQFEIEQVDLASKKTASGEDYLAVNPKGYVPALRLDDGQVLTEDQVILQYLADQKPAAALAPPAGTMERYRLMEWLAFIATEVHKGFGPFWNPSIPDSVKELARERLALRFGYLNDRLAAGPYLTGASYSIADAYLFTILGWADFHKIDLSPWPRLVDYRGRIFARPAVQEAMRAEKLIP
jgi:glutathione S-transferase